MWLVLKFLACIFISTYCLSLYMYFLTFIDQKVKEKKKCPGSSPFSFSMKGSFNVTKDRQLLPCARYLQWIMVTPLLWTEVEVFAKSPANMDFCYNKHQLVVQKVSIMMRATVHLYSHLSTLLYYMYYVWRTSLWVTHLYVTSISKIKCWQLILF